MDKVYIFLKGKIFPLLFIAFACETNLYGQQPEKANRGERAKSSVSVRTQSLYGGTSTEENEAIWKRVIYRQLDLVNQKENTPLYYPAEPTDERCNFFTTLFRLVYKGKIPAYEYRDGEEVFDDSSKVKIKDIFEKFQILYTEEKVGRVEEYFVENSDIPSSEVKTLYIKERYLFNQHSCEYESEIEALCPVLQREDEFGGEELKYPLFWVKMSDLKPYLSSSYVMAGDMNNASHRTLNDYFVLRFYKGQIYKSTNMLNRTLMQYCPDEDSLSKEQARIEKELEMFEKGIWTNDTLSPQKSPYKKGKKSKNCFSSTNKKYSSPKGSKLKGGESSSSNDVVYSVRKER